MPVSLLHLLSLVAHPSANRVLGHRLHRAERSEGVPQHVVASKHRPLAVNRRCLERAIGFIGRQRDIRLRANRVLAAGVSLLEPLPHDCLKVLMEIDRSERDFSSLAFLLAEQDHWPLEVEVRAL